MLILSKTLAMRRRMKMMLRKAELMMVLAAGSNVRIRTEDGGRFTSSRALLYISHTPTCTYIHCTHLHLHTFAVTYDTYKYYTFTHICCTYKYKHMCCVICINTYNHTYTHACMCSSAVPHNVVQLEAAES